MLIIYTFVLFLVLVLGLPYWLLRMATNGKYREGFSERLGWVPKRLRDGGCKADHLGACGVGWRGTGGQPPGE